MDWNDLRLALHQEHGLAL